MAGSGRTRRWLLAAAVLAAGALVLVALARGARRTVIIELTPAPAPPPVVQRGVITCSLDVLHRRGIVSSALSSSVGRSGWSDPDFELVQVERRPMSLVQLADRLPWLIETDRTELHVHFALLGWSTSSAIEFVPRHGHAWVAIVEDFDDGWSESDPRASKLVAIEFRARDGASQWSRSSCGAGMGEPAEPSRLRLEYFRFGGLGTRRRDPGSYDVVQRELGVVPYGIGVAACDPEGRYIFAVASSGHSVGSGVNVLRIATPGQRMIGEHDVRTLLSTDAEPSLAGVEHVHRGRLANSGATVFTVGCSDGTHVLFVDCDRDGAFETIECLDVEEFCRRGLDEAGAWSDDFRSYRWPALPSCVPSVPSEM